MAAPTKAKADFLNRSGRFREALREFSGHRASLPTADQVLYLELLQRTGRNSEALAGALDLSRKNTLNSEEAGWCEIIAGRALQELGELGAAREHLLRATLTGERLASPTLLCWSILTLVRVVSESAGDEAAVALLPKARKAVRQLGQARASAALHVFMSEVETRRGLFTRARRHLEVARTVLGSSDEGDLWLDGLADICESCLMYLVSDLVQAGQRALSAIKKAEASGHHSTSIAALTNLGHIRLASGDYREAEEYLHRALTAAGRETRTRVAILDGLAQCSLARGDLEHCAEVLSSVVDVESLPTDRISYYDICTLLTKVRLLASQKCYTQASALAENALSRFELRIPPSLAAQLWLLRASSELLVHDTPKGAACLYQAMRRSPESSTEVLADLHRVTGMFHAHSGDIARGWASLARSARILAAIGHNSARTAVVAELRALLEHAAHGPFDNAERNRKPWPAVEPQWPAPPTLAAVNPVASTLDKAAALCDFAPYPEILAAEAAALLLDARAAGHIALLTRTASGTLATPATWSLQDAKSSAPLPPPVVIELGHRRDLDFQLAVTPGTGLAARSAVLAVKTVVDAACALEAARREKRESTALWPIEPETDHPRGIFVSEKMTELVAVARKVADAQAIVLLTGETGTGKEVLARFIHEASSSARQPFVPFNCSSAPRDLVDSQLFGYRRGAFTGAVASFDGVIRAATGGILFLDEIGDLPLDVQPKLLRFIEMNEVHPLGEPHPVKVKVRVIAATNADLGQLVAEGRFREDLYYRLNVIRLHLPPLRERREEIPSLANHYLSRFSNECKKDNLRLAEETMEYLVLWRWPGNVRELVNEIRRMAALAEPGAVLMPEHLSRQIVESRRTVPATERTLLPTEIVVRLDQPHAAMTEHAERSQIVWALSVYGTREAAARALGLSRKGLYLKCRRLGIETEGAEPVDDY